MNEWMPIETAPIGVVVDTIIRDADGDRNHQTLKASQRDPNCRVMWWLPDGSMYVYFTPTHWRPVPSTARCTPEQP